MKEIIHIEGYEILYQFGYMAFGYHTPIVDIKCKHCGDVFRVNYGPGNISGRNIMRIVKQ